MADQLMIDVEDADGTSYEAGAAEGAEGGPPRAPRVIDVPLVVDLPEPTGDASQHPVEARVVRSADGSWRWTARWSNDSIDVSRPFRTREEAAASVARDSGAARGLTAIHLDGPTRGAVAPIPESPIHGLPPKAAAQRAAAQAAGTLRRSTSERMAALIPEGDPDPYPVVSQRAREHAAADAGIGS